MRRQAAKEIIVAEALFFGPSATKALPAGCNTRGLQGNCNRKAKKGLADENASGTQKTLALLIL